MEKPIVNWLNDKYLDFPFMLFWANEDWTNTWGEKAEVGTKTYSAKMKPGDAKKFVADILPFLKDKRYIKVDGRPHLIIYQAKKDPYLPTFIREIGQLIEKNHIAKPYISLVFPDTAPEDFDPISMGADAAVEFGAHMMARPDLLRPPVRTPAPIMNRSARLTSYNMHAFVKEKDFLYDTDYPSYKGVMTTFDNTARKIYSGAQLFSLTPELYREWLSEVIRSSDNDYVFISAWNEWAEGMHLEPDQRYGYAYLQATREALEESRG